MTILNVIDENTGEFVAVDVDAPSGSLYVRDADTGEFLLLDLSTPTGIAKVIDANTGEFVSIDYSAPTGTLNVIDPNTGEFLAIDLASPTGTLYCIDDSTGEFIQLDISTAKFFKSGELVLLNSGVGTTYHLNFDGSSFITIPHASSIDNLPVGDFTIESVTKVTPHGTGLQIGALFNKHAGVGGFYYSLVSAGAGWRYASLDLIASDYFYYDSPADAELASVFDGQYHHFEMNYFAATQTVKFFVDGILQTDGLVDIGAGFVTNGYDISDASIDLLIGKSTLNPAYNHHGSNRWFRVSNVARHTVDFTAPSLTICPATDANTVLLLALDKGTGTTVVDTSGNNNNGTITGATWEQD